jgi:hypothetical protein
MDVPRACAADKMHLPVSQFCRMRNGGEWLCGRAEAFLWRGELEYI